MRKITLDNLHTLDEEMFYGVLANGRTLGCISRDDYERGQWRARCESEFTQGNGWSGTDSGLSLLECVKFLVGGTVGFKVYEFSTFRELCGWIANGGHAAIPEHEMEEL